MTKPSYIKTLGISLTAALIFLLSGINSVFATHYLAGQITYTKTGTNKYRIRLTTYADRSSGVYAANCFVSFEMGDGTILSNIPRMNGPGGGTCGGNAKMGEEIIRNIQKSIYEVEYTYAGPGIFQVRFYDDNRYANIINMSNSVSTSFYVYSTIRNIPGLSSTSPELLNDPVDIACIGELFTHSPGGVDIDGDSLAYTLIPSMQYRPQGTPNVPFPVAVNNYQFPDNVSGNIPGTFNQDNQTGLISWNVPIVAGYYNIAFRVVSYRRGTAVDSVVRDMVIIVDPNCNNRPPKIKAILDTCVSVGDTLRFEVKAWDPDPTDSVYLYLNNSGSGNNGPFASYIPAPQATITFTPPSSIPVKVFADTIQGMVEWIVNCDHVRKYFYQIDFFAHDNLNRPPNQKFLTAYHSTRIRVRPPALKNLRITPVPGAVQLSWSPSLCTDLHSYRIYRREGGGPYTSDTVCCTNTPESAGFTLIATSRITDPPNGIYAINDTTYLDTQLEYGKTYCYVIVGNVAESPISQGILTCPTNMECIELANEAPLITNVSVEATSNTNGIMFIRWTRPLNIDSSNIIAPRPFTYSVYRADGIGSPVFNLLRDSLVLTDTTVYDTLLNTTDLGHVYQVRVIDQQNQEISRSTDATSIYLELIPNDQQILLNWSSISVPWQNTQYFIWRRDSSNLPFVKIDSVLGTETTYLDTGLTNYQTYCYYISSLGNYSSPQVIDSLFNLSQQTCETPRDLTPPCLPPDDSYYFQGNCEELSINFNWGIADTVCAGDIDHYLIGYSTTRGSNAYQLIGKTTSPSITNFVYQFPISIAGCYALQAVDTAGNKSAFSPEFCVDNCPDIEMSNVFTPNDDGNNDFFTPIRLRAVKLYSFAVYDRWGNLLYSQNSDPVRLWDGSTQNGKALEGVYFYVLKGRYIRLDKQEDIEKVGTVTLLR